MSEENVIVNDVQDSSPEINEQSSVELPSSEEASDLVQEAIENGASEKQVANMIKEFNLKVNGKDFVKKIDLSNEDEIKKELQFALAGRKAMEESSNMKKLYDTEMQRLKNDPMSFLNELGLDSEDVAVSFLKKRIEEQENASKKTPEQVEKEALEAKLHELQTRLEREEAQREKEAMEKLQMESNHTLENEMIDALESDPDLPNTERVLQEIARAMIWAYKNNYTDIKAKDVLPTVKRKLEKEFNDVLDNVSDEAFERYVGKRNLEKRRTKKLEQIKKIPKAPVTKVESTGNKPVQEKIQKKTINLEDFLRGF